MDNSPNRIKDNGQFGIKHGLTNHKWYPMWRAMTGRCYNESNNSYFRYGGRGITVCEQWRHEPTKFILWLASQGHKPGLQLDRIDNDGDYSPSNCRLVSRSANCRNRRDNRRYEVNGEMLLACEVEEKYGVSWTTFRARVDNYGWDANRAAMTPVRSRLCPL